MANRKSRAISEVEGPFGLACCKDETDDLIKAIEAARSTLNVAGWQANDDDIDLHEAGEIMRAAELILRAALDRFETRVNVPMLREINGKPYMYSKEFGRLPRNEQAPAS